MTIPDKANLSSEELVRSWGLEPRPVPAEDPFTSEPTRLGRAASYYLDIGAGLGGLIGFATFFGAYIYCISTYGFIFGFGLGWIPAGLVTIIVSQVVRFLWGPLILLIALVLIFFAR